MSRRFITLAQDEDACTIGYMHEFWQRAEHCWNRNRAVAWILVLLGLGLALWACLCPQSPGVSIGLLAGVAGIMSLRPEMHPAEKSTWVVVLVTFTILEVLAIGRADKSAEKVREAQNHAFQTIAEELKTSMSLDKTQYDSTITHVDTVLTKTQQAADTAEEAVRDMTGGDSWGWVSVQQFSDIPNRFFFSVDNEGKKYALRGVRLAILDKSKPRGPFSAKQCDVGDIAPHTGYNAPFTDPCIIQINPLIKSHFLIIVGALNGGTYEDLYLSPGANGPTQTYKVYRVFPNGKSKTLKQSAPKPQ
jgi:hypothetical protein